MGWREGCERLDDLNKYRQSATCEDILKQSFSGLADGVPRPFFKQQELNPVNQRVTTERDPDGGNHRQSRNERQLHLFASPTDFVCFPCHDLQHPLFTPLCINKKHSK